MHLGDEIQAHLRRAEQAEGGGDTAGAIKALEAATLGMQAFAMQAISGEAKARRAGKARELRARIDRLREGKPSCRQPSSSTGPANHEAGDDYRQAARALVCRTAVSWSDIGGLDGIRRDLGAGFALALARRPEGVRVDGFRNILLYGPPGTGKTMIAAAVSGQLDATFFNVKASDLLSKYFGESTRLVDALYAEARAEADQGLAVVFIDEFDSLCPPRSGDTSGAERRLLSTLLAVLDGLREKGEDGGVMTLAATNTPWALDDAIRSRFQKRVLVGYPDQAQRQAILQALIDGRGLAHASNLAAVAEATDWFSGRDLEAVVRFAVAVMVERCNPGLGELAEQGRAAMEAHVLALEPLRQADFAAGLARVAVSREGRQREAERYRAWA